MSDGIISSRSTVSTEERMPLVLPFLIGFPLALNTGGLHSSVVLEYIALSLGKVVLARSGEAALFRGNMKIL